MEDGKFANTDSKECHESVIPCKKITGAPSAFPCSAYSSLTRPGKYIVLTTGCGVKWVISNICLEIIRLIFCANGLMLVANATSTTTMISFFINFVFSLRELQRL